MHAAQPLPAPVAGDRLLSELDAEQQAAVEARGSTIYVLAGPGSGKSRVITARIVHLLRVRAVPSWQIACYVFTRAAAQEVRGRVVAAVGQELAASLRVGTFHAFALRVLRATSREALDSKHWPAEPWRVADEEEAEEVLRGIFRGAEARPEARKTGINAVREASMLHAAYGRWGRGEQWDLLKVWWKRLAERGLVSHDRLVPAALAAADADQGAARVVGEAQHVLIDEGQDLTSQEWLLATGREQAVMLVADPRQAIFGWRGATHLEDLLKPFRTGIPPVGEQMLTLARSYRCRRAVADYANGLAAALKVPAAPIEPVPGPSFVEQGLSRALLPSIVADLASRYGGAANVAVLARTNAECVAAAAEIGPDLARLIRRTGDPALRMGEAALRLTVNRGDNAAARLVLRGMGWDDDTIRYVEQEAGAARSLWGQAVLDDSAAACPLDELRPAAFQRLEQEFGRGWETRDPQALLDELSDRQEADLFAEAAEAKRVAVATVHAAKGREWDAVVLLTSRDWPGPRPRPEEIRTQFVASTRARAHLAIVET